MNNLWNDVLHEIEVEVSKPTFLAFFKDTQLVSLQDNIATISAPSYMIASYIEKRYYSLIKKILDTKTQLNTSLIFTAKGKISVQQKESGPLFVEQIKRATTIKNKRLRSDYTFDTLAVSESNQLAYTASLSIAQQPGGKYNPLFLYGTVGVGKTHLMHAVANKILSDKGDIHVLYLTTEEFTNEVVEAIRDKTTPSLRKKFRNVDLLLLDDIQFLSGKERVQEELFHTFNTLVDKGKQIIFTSDKPPHEIRKIEARLASRFESGLTVDIEPPDFELRAAILLKKCEKHNLPLSFDQAKLIAERLSDTRALEGFLLRLMTELSTKNVDNSDRVILRLLGEKVREDSVATRPDDIITVICSYYSIKTTQLKGVKREASLVRSRHICMYLLKEVGLTYAEVGNLLGGRDHTTIMHGVEKIRSQLTTSDIVKEDINSIKRKIQENLVQ